MCYLMTRENMSAVVLDKRFGQGPGIEKEREGKGREERTAEVEAACLLAFLDMLAFLDDDLKGVMLVRGGWRRRVEDGKLTSQVETSSMPMPMKAIRPMSLLSASMKMTAL